MKLAEALAALKSAPSGAIAHTTLLACGFSPLHLKTFLGAHLQAALTGRKVEIETGLYGSLAETVERISGSSCETAALFIEWPDLDARLGYRSLGGWGDGIVAPAQAMLARLANGLAKKPSSLRIVVSLPTLGLPPAFHTVGWQASTSEVSLEHALSEFASQISSVPGVLVLNRQRLDLVSPPQERYDFRSDLNAGFPYTLKHADLLAAAMANLLTLPLPKKGLISDLDDTMWRGIVGEDGPEGVAWDLASHAQVHGLYQQMLQSLAAQGVLIGIASKNNAETAEKAMRRSDFVLPREKIFPAEIHWEAKSGSVSRILKTWNIAADSVVFVDDSPMEIEEVRAAHPGIECILFPKKDYAAAFALLQRLRDLFGKTALSAEDAFRLESIRNSQQFLEQAADVDMAEQFLRAAEATMTFEFDPPLDDRRVLELVNKTNQFNLNGRRFTEAEWERLVSAPGAFVAVVSYQDKFGPLGKIAVVAGRLENSIFKMQTWVMSCRAFSRRIEYQVLRQIFDKTGVELIEFEFTATAKNEPLREFLKSLHSPLSKADFDARCPALYHQVAIWTTQNSA